MGVNATTFVPTYVSGEVLTAADLNVTNSGIPVFADSTARDASFGGTGEKVLAEGQFAYLEDVNAFQVYDGASWVAAVAVSALDSNYVQTFQNTASTTYVGLATASSVTLTTGTKAIVIVDSQSSNATVGANVYMSFAISGATTTAASDDYSSAYRVQTSSYALRQTAVYPVVLTAGSNTFTTQFRTDAGTAQFGRRTITVLAYA